MTLHLFSHSYRHRSYQAYFVSRYSHSMCSFVRLHSHAAKLLINFSHIWFICFSSGKWCARTIFEPNLIGLDCIRCGFDPFAGVWNADWPKTNSMFINFECKVTNQKAIRVENSNKRGHLLPRWEQKVWNIVYEILFHFYVCLLCFAFFCFYECKHTINYIMCAISLLLNFLFKN